MGIFPTRVAKVILDPTLNVQQLRQLLTEDVTLVKQGYFEHCVHAAAVLERLWLEGKRATRTSGSTRGRVVKGISSYRHGKYGRDE